MKTVQPLRMKRAPSSAIVWRALLTGVGEDGGGGGEGAEGAGRRVRVGWVGGLERSVYAHLGCWPWQGCRGSDDVVFFLTFKYS